MRDYITIPSIIHVLNNRKDGKGSGLLLPDANSRAVRERLQSEFVIFYECDAAVGWWEPAFGDEGVWFCEVGGGADGRIYRYRD